MLPCLRRPYSYLLPSTPLCHLSPPPATSRQPSATSLGHISRQAFDAFGSLCDNATPIINPFVGDLVSLVLQVALESEIPLPLRDCALLSLSNLARTRPRTLFKPKAKAGGGGPDALPVDPKNGYVPIIVQTLLQVMTEPQEDEDEDDDGAEGKGDDDDEEDEDDWNDRTSHDVVNLVLEHLASKMPVQVRKTCRSRTMYICRKREKREKRERKSRREARSVSHGAI